MFEILTRLFNQFLFIALDYNFNFATFIRNIIHIVILVSNKFV